MLTTRRIVDDGVRMCAGRAAPSSTGPTVTPWPLVTFSTLNRMLAASRFGRMRTFASPRNALTGRKRSRISCDSAASPCSSPSHSMSGARCLNRSAAWRMRRAEARFDDPKFECDTKATFGARPKRRTSTAAISAISASAAASGSSLTNVSAMNSVRLSSSTAFIVANVFAPGLSPMTSRTCSRCWSKRPTSPVSMASASPRRTIIAEISVFERRRAALAISGVTPSRPIRWW